MHPVVPAPAGDHQSDRGGGGDDERPLRQGVGGDRRHDDGGEGRVEDRAAHREAVGRRARGGGDDDSVSAEARDRVAADRDLERSDASGRPAVQDRVVQGAVGAAVRPVGDRHVEAAAAVLAEAAGEDLVQARQRLFLLQAGQVAQGADVDADHGRRRRRVAGDREERSVPAQHDDEVGDARDPVAAKVGLPPHLPRRLVVEEHLDSAAPQGPFHAFGQPERPRRDLGDQADRPEPGPAASTGGA